MDAKTEISVSSTSIKVLDTIETKTYDIELYSPSLQEKITQLDDGNFQVRIPIPDEFKDKDLVVYYIDE